MRMKSLYNLCEVHKKWCSWQIAEIDRRVSCFFIALYLSDEVRKGNNAFTLEI